jgi:hypothetical protein
MADKHEAVIEPCFDQAGRDPGWRNQPTQQYVGIEDNAHGSGAMLRPGQNATHRK